MCLGVLPCIRNMPMRPDIEEHLPLLDEFDMSVEEKREMLETLLLFIENHIDQAFGKHPVQQACGEDEEKLLPASHRWIESERRKNKAMLNKVSDGNKHV